MKNFHHFNLKLNWSFEIQPKSISNRVYKKSHILTFPNQLQLDVSAAKTFKGDPNLFNPEDLLLSSLTSCHMMSYQYCCQTNAIELVAYEDQSEAILEVNPNGSGRIIKVILNPIVTINDESQIELANSLHEKAKQLCFIGSSCNFSIEVNPLCKVD